MANKREVVNPGSKKLSILFGVTNRELIKYAKDTNSTGKSKREVEKLKDPLKAMRAILDKATITIPRERRPSFAVANGFGKSGSTNNGRRKTILYIV